MRTLIKQLVLAIIPLVSLTACSKDNTSYIWEEPAKTVYNIYHQPQKGWVGDLMPYYLDGKFKLYYLNDATNLEKQSSSGQHPIFSLTTENLIDVVDDGEVIPYGNKNTQDHLIGTGSMIQVSGVYYFYYTGHNGSSAWLQSNNPAWSAGNPKEAVMYATSTDGKVWTKDPKPIITAPQSFERNDFRDPYVFFNEEFQTYWMLISTRQNGKGVLLTYTNDDPATKPWVQSDVLDVEGNYLMLECADIFKIGSLYYMLFAEDWSSAPGTRYRVANSTKGPWRIPANGRDMFDGHQFYAGKTASNGSTRYGFAWAHRRSPETDNGARTWGGNLITHEVYAPVAGQLAVKAPAIVDATIARPTVFAVQNKVGNVQETTNSITLGETEQAAKATLTAVSGTQKIEATIHWADATGIFSIGFGDNRYEVRFDKQNNKISGLNNGDEVTRVFYDFSNKQNLNLKIIIDGAVVVVYVDEQVALTNRVYSMQGKALSFSAQGAAIAVQNLKAFSKD